MTRIGWIGLGAMGAPMATVAARDHDVRVYDIVPEAAHRVAGATPVPSIAAAADGADILVLMVATGGQVESALFGENGAAAALRPGAVVVIMATVGPGSVDSWRARLAERQVDLVDAPVSGGVSRAAQGDLLIMVSGSSAAVTRARTLLDALARTAPLVGETPGDGQKVKLVNQLLCGVHIAAAAEALAFAESIGLDPLDCWEVIRHGAAASFMLDDRGGRMARSEHDTVLSAVDIFVKDLGLVTAAAAQAGARTPGAAAAQEVFREASDAGLGRRDDSIVIDVLRRP